MKAQAPLEKTPEKQNIANSSLNMSPKEHQFIGFNKSMSPKTPVHLESSQRLEKSNHILVQSKSINGSGNKQQINLYPDQDESYEIQDINGQKLNISQELKLGQEVISQGKASNQGIKPFSGIPEAQSSSIFTNTPFREAAPVATQGKINDVEKNCLNFIENLMDDDTCQLKITQDDFKKENEAQAKEDSKGFNAMTLFAYSGDSKNDCFASAFASKEQPHPIHSLFGESSPKSNSIISNSFDEADEERLNSTLESSEINTTQNQKFETFESLYASLSQEDQQILCNLNFHCFDQVGCRMLQ